MTTSRKPAPDPGAEDRRATAEDHERRLGELTARIEALKHEEQVLSAVVDRAGAGFLELDGSGTVVWANRQVESWFGDRFGSGSAAGLPCHRVLCGRSKPCDACPTARARESGQVAHHELRLGVGSKLRHIYVTVVPVAVPGDDSGRTMVMLQDISDLDILRSSEAALRNSEQRFRSIFLSAAAGTVVTRSDGSFLQVNPAFCRMLGYSEDELLRKKVSEITHPADLQRTVGYFKDVEAGKRRTVEMEKRYLRRDGGVVWALTTSTWLFDDEGNPLHSVALVQDITERKQAERTIEERQSRLRYHQDTLLELAQCASLVEGDLVAALAEITEVCSRVLGVARTSVWIFADDGASLECLDLYDAAAESHSGGTRLAESDFPRYFDALECDRAIAAHDAHTDPRTHEFSGPYLEPLGISSVLDAPVRQEGRTIGVVWQEHVGPRREWTLEEEHFAGSIADLVALALEQQGRREAEGARRLLATAIDQAAESIVITDTDGTVQYVNPAFGRATGFTPDEVIGSAPRSLEGAGDEPRILRAMRETVRRNEVWSGHLTSSRRDGIPCHEETTISPVRDDAGRVVNVVAVSRDVTRQTELEEQLRQSQKMQAIGNLAGGVAHDFNNILTGILGYADLILRLGGKNERVRQAAEVIGRAARRGAELTQQLLGFARKGKNRNVRVDLHGSVGDVIDLLSHTVDKNINMVAHLEADCPFVLGDPSQIQQVLLNLAVNARDAMPGGGELSFATGTTEIVSAGSPVPRGRYLTVTVRDSGHGIEAENLERIFEPFFTTKDPGKGTGMGLAMVYGIVENHGGTVQVSSRVGEGTTFRVLFPLAPEESAGDEAAEEEAVAQRGGRVLVVDDELFVRDMAGEMLHELGYEVLTAADGAKAVEIYRDRGDEIDLVLLDMIMPGKGGRECFRELKTLDPDVRAVLSSGYGFNVAVQEILDEGVLAFLPKPYTVNELADALGKGFA